MKRFLWVASILFWLPSASHAADEVHWTVTGPHGVTFDWRGGSGQLRYGRTAAYGNAVTGHTPTPQPFSSSGPFWEAPLDGLDPGVTYHYSIDGGPDHTFHTTPPPGATFTVYVEADVGDATSFPRVSVVQSLIAAGRPSFVLVVGDLTYANDEGQSAADRHFVNTMTWSQDAAYMPAWGNHEWDSSGDDLRNYKGRFDLPNARASVGAPSAGCCGEDWYWFDAGNVRLIAYPEPYPSAWADWVTEAKTLMDDAQADTAIHFIVTFGHRPAYSSGYHPGDSRLKGYLDGLGDTHPKYVLNLNGHSHNYERSYPQHGVTHVTVGIGGSSLEESSSGCLWPSGCTPPSWSAYRAFHHGTLRLVFSPSAIVADAICGPPGDAASSRNDITCNPGESFDSFTIAGESGVPTLPQTAAALDLGSIRPNPAVARAAVAFQLATQAPARLDLIDAAGRAVMHRDVGGLGPGPHLVDLEIQGISPGIYWLRLEQAGRRAARKVVILQ